jgi:hypothetical protein
MHTPLSSSTFLMTLTLPLTHSPSISKSRSSPIEALPPSAHRRTRRNHRSLAHIARSTWASCRQKMSRAVASGSRKITFNVSEQYEIQEIVGEGAYGVVWYIASGSGLSLLLLTPCSAQHYTDRQAKESQSRRSHHSSTRCSVYARYVR